MTATPPPAGGAPGAGTGPDVKSSEQRSAGPKGAGLLGGFATVGLWTMVSRVLGFLRDVVIAAILGVGPVAEAFFVAFTLPNLFRRFFAEGAFNTAFVPLFAKRLEGEGRESARAFAEEAFAGLATVLIVFTLIAQLAMPWLVLALASGLAGDARFDLAVDFGRIVFPYILLISLAALMSGVLNALGRFAVAAAAPTLLNLLLIAVLLVSQTELLEPVAVAAPTQAEAGTILDLHAGTMLSLGVILAGVAQLALVWHAAARAGLPVRLRWPSLSPEMKRLAIIAAPAALAGGVMQINLVVGRQVASYWEGAIGWLWLADRVYQLPLGVIGVAIGVVLLPALSRHVRAGDRAAARHALGRAGEFALALTLPATVALIAIPALIVAVLFERGAFGPQDVGPTALALAVYAAGLPAFVLQKVVQPAFFSREDTRTPLRYAVWSMLVNVAVALAGSLVIGWLAAPLAATAAAWANLVLLWRGALRAEPHLAPDTTLRRRVPRMLLAALAMGAIILGLATLTEGLGAYARTGALAAIVVAGMAAYGAIGLAIGGFSLSDLKAGLRRRG
ncbi:MAG: murein biosynthesis integral membrane protein MurJ [Pseudomonadota bacterium]